MFVRADSARKAKGSEAFEFQERCSSENLEFKRL
jgi:hypothetical protein